MTETAHPEFDFDPAVLMHLSHELAYTLRQVSQLYNRRIANRVFTQEEYCALRDARDILEVYATEYGVDWAEFDEQDQNLRGM